MLAAGIRAFVGKLSMDKSSRPSYVEASAEAALKDAASFADKCLAIEDEQDTQRRLVEPVLTPRFVPTCSDELLHGLGQLSESKGLRIQSHMAEAYDQVAWVRGERGMEDMYVFDKVWAPSPCVKMSCLYRHRLARPPDTTHHPSALHIPR